MDALVGIVGDSRLAVEPRVAACNVLGWLGEDARTAGLALADVLVGVGAGSELEVRVAAARALLKAANLPDLVAPLVTNADRRRDVLGIGGGEYRLE